MKTRSAILSHLFSLHRRGRIKYDLERIAEASCRLGEPHRAYPSFHVAGTNGKGAVCSMLEAMLRGAGKKTGLFIKPHLVDFEERFLIDGKPVAADRWLDIWAELEQKLEDLTLTFFEICALMAYEVFRREEVDFAVFETGMGGRLDATSIVVPEASAITAIGLDHTDWLGTTLPAIAREKLGIVKPGVPVVMIEPQDAEVEAVARQVCEDRGSPLSFVGESQATELVLADDHVGFTLDSQTYTVPLTGRHQIVNALCALEVARQAGIGTPESNTDALAGLYLPARFQVLEHAGRTLVLEIAHNPDAIAAFTRSLRRRFPKATVCAVTGMMADKDISSSIKLLADAADSLVLCTPDIPRACPPDRLDKLAAPHSQARTVIPTVADAVDHALNSDADVVCVVGSFYTAGEAMAHLGIRPYGKSLESGV